MDQAEAGQASNPVCLSDVACECQLRLVVTSLVGHGQQPKSVSTRATHSRRKEKGSYTTRVTPSRGLCCGYLLCCIARMQHLPVHQRMPGSLPDANAIFWFQVQSVSGFDSKRFVPRIHVSHNAVDAILTWAVWVGD